MRKRKNFERAEKLLQTLLVDEGENLEYEDFEATEIEGTETIDDSKDELIVKREGTDETEESPEKKDEKGPDKEKPLQVKNRKPTEKPTKHHKIIPIPKKGDRKVYFSYLNLLWDEGGERKMAAFKQMSTWISRCKHYNQTASTTGNFVVERHRGDALERADSMDSLPAGKLMEGEEKAATSSADANNDGLSKSLQARCYTKLAQWYLELHERELDEADIPTMIETSKQALEHDPEWHKAWRTWAVTNYTALQYYHKKSENHPKIASHHLPAVSGFIRAISLSPSENLQDTLRLLSLWFSYGYHKDIDAAIRDGFKTLNIDTWLSVLPQLIARIHVYHVRSGISQLLTKLGEKHPQALVFPITVATKDPMRTRVTAAHAIMNELKQHSSKLLQEAAIVSRYALALMRR